MFDIDQDKIRKFKQLEVNINILNDLFDEIEKDISKASFKSEEQAIQSYHDYHALQRIKAKVKALVSENEKQKLNEEKE
ncbi:hypothetical protein [Citrobacter farmeri]|uniref:hypothetical protein n=1 Tax=Citrobacter farmeri TaxID=67824 RepID=UPI0019017387|nr:hypothetical protein [Citrobacter farmeri]MBJ9134426.1 hypothetical protein [Citrobacter farmeri]